MRKLFCLIILLFLASCSSEKPVDKDTQQSAKAEGLNETAAVAPSNMGIDQYSLKVTPLDPKLKSTLKLYLVGFDLNDAKIAWLVNGETVYNPDPQRFDAKNTKKGDTVQVRALIEGREILSNKVTIKNTPPEIQHVKFLPEVVRPGDRLSVDATAGDADGDDVVVAYEWTKNGEPAGTGKQIEGALKRGDKMVIKLTPFDGESYGTTAILNREIANMSPVITENNKYVFDGKVFTYQIIASDADGDPVAYSLKTAPDDMKINQGTGLITWNVPSDFNNETSFVVEVTDDKGGKVTQSINFKIIPEQK